MMIKYTFNKLIRDKVILRMLEEEVIVNSRLLSEQQYISELFNKLLEEAEEARVENEKHRLTIELADVLEVLSAIADANNIDMSDIEYERQKKCELNGTFTPNTYVNHIEVSKNNHKVIKYLGDRYRHYVLQ